MATYANNQQYISTNRYSRSSTGFISAQTSNLYVVPTNTVAYLYLQYAAVVSHSSSANIAKIEMTFSGSSTVYPILANGGVADVYAYLYGMLNAPYILLPGDAIRFNNSTSGVDTESFQYEFVVVEMRKA